MTAQRGRNLLIKIGDGGESEVFTTVAGLRSASLAFNSTNVDVTNSDSADSWRELLAGGGVKSAGISGSGVFKDAASDAALKTAFFNAVSANWQIAQDKQIQTIIRKVPVYVSAKSNSVCAVLPWGAVRLLDAAASGSDPDTVRARIAPGVADDAPSDVGLPEAVALLAANLGFARQNAEQLRALQAATSAK